MSKQQMALQAAWDDREQLIEHLAGEAYLGRLTIMLGAGVSKPLGLPEWGELVERCEVARNAPGNMAFDLPRRAELLLRNAYGSDEREFAMGVRDELYKEVRTDIWSMRENRTLAAIAAVTQSAAMATSTVRVITLNFDDLLEAYLRGHGCPANSVTSPDGAETFAQVHVLHPHGLLPVFEADVQGRLVFDRHAFSTVIADRDGWQTKLVEAMKGRTCLFVGMSMLDDHLEVLFSRVNSMRHASGAGAPVHWGVWLTGASQQASETATLLEFRGIHTVQVREFGEDLPAFLFGICAALGELNSR